MTQTATLPSIGRCPECKTTTTAVGVAYVICACGGQVWLSEVKGRTTKRPCGEHCTEGTGKSCSCECGGANHGFVWRIK